MGFPWSIEKILGWRKRHDAVCRWGIRCRNCYDGNTCVNESDFVDFFLAFMVMCYSLRDFVTHSGGVKASDIDNMIGDCKAMRICRDVSNRGKHHTIKHRPSIDKDWSLRKECVPFTNNGSRYLLIAGSDIHDPLILIEECENFWNRLISVGMFTEPKNPFSKD